MSDTRAYRELARLAEVKYGLPTGLVSSVIETESNFNPDAVNKKSGARGIAQFMPSTAKQYGVNVNDAASSIDGAGRYLGEMYQDNNGDVAKTLASYNWGPGNLARKGLVSAPRETRNYIAKVNDLMNPIGTANASEEPSNFTREMWRAQQNKISEPEELSREEWRAQQAQPVQQAQEQTPAEIVPQQVPAAGNWEGSTGNMSIPWSEVPMEAIKNIPQSGMALGKGLYDAATSPIETGKAIGGILRGGMQKALPDQVTEWAISSGLSPDSRPQAEQAWEAIKGRYGSEDALKQTISSDPVGVAADISTILTGAGGLAKGAGLVGAGSKLSKAASL